MAYKYKVVEENEDPMKATIEKTGGKVRFNLHELKESIKFGRKTCTELEGTWKVAEATKENIKRTHPHIAEMGEEDLVAAYLFRQAIGTANEAQRKLADMREALEEDEEAVEEILKQTKLVVPGVKYE